METESTEQEINNTYGPDFDVRSLMADAKDPFTGTLRDLRIDDRELPVAKNYSDWAFNVSGSNSRPWSRQLWALLHLFGEICPVCTKPNLYNDIFSIPKDMDGEDLSSRLVLLEYGVCPHCRSRKSDLIRQKKMPLRTEAVWVWGQRSGKSTTVVSGSSYHTHRFLKFPVMGTLTPAMDPATPLVASMVSLSFGKAFSVLWEPLKKHIANTPWYTELFRLLDYYGRQYGEELYNRRKEFLQFNHKNLVIRPTSPDWPSLRGDTRYEGIIDELGLFRLPDESEDATLNDADDTGEDTSKRANADEAHKSLENSLVTVRQAAEHLLLEKGVDFVPTGLLFGVSSPTSIRDKVMRLLAESRSDSGMHHMLGLQLPTWEVNPSIQRDSQVILNAFSRNAVKAERDFGANPPQTNNSYITVDTVTPLVQKFKNSHVLEYVYGPDGSMWGRAIKRSNVPPTPSILVLDAGLNNNSFAIHTMTLTPEGRIRTTCSCEVIPSRGRHINFNKMYSQAILPIAKANHSVFLAADQWQSLDTGHRFVEDCAYPKAKFKRFSLRRKHFDAVRQSMEEHMFLLPFPEVALDSLFDAEIENYRKFFLGKPVAHLLHQFTTIRDVGPTATPEKGIGMTDDLARAWFLGAYLIQDIKVVQLLRDAQKTLKLDTGSGSSVVGAFVSRGNY